VTLKRSLKVIESGTIQKLGCSLVFAFHSNCVKEWRDLGTRGRGGSRSLKLALFDTGRSRTTFYWSAIVNIALSCTVFELFDVE